MLNFPSPTKLLLTSICPTISYCIELHASTWSCVRVFNRDRTYVMIHNIRSKEHYIIHVPVYLTQPTAIICPISPPRITSSPQKPMMTSLQNSTKACPPRSAPLCPHFFYQVQTTIQTLSLRLFLMSKNNEATNRGTCSCMY